MNQMPSYSTFLLITDNPAIVHWMRTHLDKQFYLLETSTREAALNILSTTRIEFILLDFYFENSNDFEICKRIRQINTIVPILLITGKLKKDFRENALNAGVTDFLSDRLDQQELETRIAIGKKAAEQRKKTAELSEHIPTPNEVPTHFFKSKFLLNDKALNLLAEAQNKHAPISFLIVRIDHLNELEARLGMTQIESLLHFLSQILCNLLSKNDLLMPHSDGRFILLLPQTSYNAAKSFAERLRKQVVDSPFLCGTESIALTVSIALSSPDPQEQKLSKIIDTAANALKQAESITNSILSLDQGFT